MTTSNSENIQFLFLDDFASPILVLNRQWHVLFVNQLAASLWGRGLLEQTFATAVAEQGYLDLAGNSRPSTLALALTDMAGDENEIVFSLLYADTDYVVALGTIPTSEKKNKFDVDKISPSQKMFRALADHYRGSVIISDCDNKILYANPACLSMSGYNLDELVGQSPQIFKSGQTPEWSYVDLWQTLEAGKTWRGQFINRRKNGEVYPEEKIIASIKDEHDNLLYYYAFGEDIRRLDNYHHRMAHFLTIDRATGLPNREAFLCILEDELSLPLADGASFSILHIDIDDFIGIQSCTDARSAEIAAISIANKLRKVLRQTDALARVGQDRFAVLLSPRDPTTIRSVNEVCSRILDAIRHPSAQPDIPIQITASIGIASDPLDGVNAIELFTNAMAATDVAKKRGGDTFCAFEDLSNFKLGERRRLVADLKSAIEHNELLLYYQPQVSLRTGSLVGLEALIRWQHPRRGLLMPGDFIHLAELSNLIIDIGEWTINEVCRQLNEWKRQGVALVKTAINLSARHFSEPGVTAFIMSTLAKYDLPPHLIEIEVTESAVMKDVGAAECTTKLMKQAGMRISLDDFGTGYSSLAYLSRFPIDLVKVDRIFVQDITVNPINAAIVQATIAMSHKLGKVALAEGVETEEQVNFLRRNDCDEMQGYFFARPLPAEEVTHLLKSRRGLMIVPSNEAGFEKIKILLVDDEPNILSSLRRALRSEDYQVLTAESAAQAFSLLAKTDVHLVISDERMPEMRGTEFLSRVKELYPATVRMILSGYADPSSITEAINRGAVYKYLLKPWDDAVLKQEIRNALAFMRDQRKRRLSETREGD